MKIFFTYYQSKTDSPIDPPIDNHSFEMEILIIIIITISAISIISLIFVLYKRRNHCMSGYDPIPDMAKPEYIIQRNELVIKERIGRGSFGEVFRATFYKTEVAVKRLPHYKLTDDLIQDLYREAMLMLKFRHPNIIAFMGLCTEKPDISIVTEYMRRGSLYDILHNDKIIIDDYHIKKFLLDTCKGMAYLHEVANIIHRDLKSHNLLVDEYWNVKVCDFGLSRKIEDQLSDLTMTSCGTPCWTAPEVLRNDKYCNKCDVYSFSICLWECCTREDPFPGLTPFQIIIEVGDKKLRLPIPPKCNPSFADLLMITWKENPSERPSFEDIIETIESINIPETTPSPTFKKETNIN